MHIIFYEKPGCSGNAKQKAFLQQAGHTLEVRSLLSWPWQRDTLMTFMDHLPVPDWFNRAAPRVKSGEVDPHKLGREEALQILLDDHLLIRRPLMMREDGRTLVGFEAVALADFLPEDVTASPGEGCSTAGRDMSCAQTVTH